MEKVTIKLTAELNKKNFQNLVNCWEEDRGARGCEWLYDLEDLADFTEFAEMYTLNGAITCKSMYRFWWGGMNYIWDDNAIISNVFIKNGIVSPSCRTDIKRDFNWILGEIEDRVIENLKSGIIIESIENLYDNMIRIEISDDIIDTIKAKCPYKDEVIKDVTKTEEKDGWAYYYITFVDGENFCAIVDKFDFNIYFPLTYSYPACLDDVRMYLWKSAVDAFMNNTYIFNAKMQVKLVSDITAKRLIRLNHSYIDGTLCDGVVLISSNPTHITFYSKAHHKKFVAIYNDSTTLKPLVIGEICNFYTGE